MALLTLGDGRHNFHHKFPADYRNGVRWWHFDVSKWFLQALRPLGQVWGLKRTPEALIHQALIEARQAGPERPMEEYRTVPAARSSTSPL